MPATHANNGTITTSEEGGGELTCNRFLIIRKCLKCLMSKSLRLYQNIVKTALTYINLSIHCKKRINLSIEKGCLIRKFRTHFNENCL